MKSDQEYKEIIEKAFITGGTFSHNIIISSLTALSKTNKSLANEIYKDLQERGF